MHSASTHTQNDVLQPALKWVLLTLLSFNPTEDDSTEFTLTNMPVNHLHV